ncbi:hypothetical protein H9P43_006388 [Blastocladiella emersonii ATCC 22665]|nr:hypothetical protein H9P43_006388 [Blastocladiella emersonii ATCC 22665]
MQRSTATMLRSAPRRLLATANTSPALPPPQSLTLALLKPDLFADPSAVAEVKSRIAAAGLRVQHSQRVTWTRDDAGDFYAEHRGRFFYERLVGYMTSGPFLAMALEHEAKGDVIKAWRGLIGPTHPVRAQVSHPDSLRGRYGLTDTRNSFHGSDSIATAARELEFFFPDHSLIRAHLARITKE